MFQKKEGIRKMIFMIAPDEQSLEANFIDESLERLVVNIKKIPFFIEGYSGEESAVLYSTINIPMWFQKKIALAVSLESEKVFYRILPEENILLEAHSQDISNVYFLIRQSELSNLVTKIVNQADKDLSNFILKIVELKDKNIPGEIILIDKENIFTNNKEIVYLSEEAWAGLIRTEGQFKIDAIRFTQSARRAYLETSGALGEVEKEAKKRLKKGLKDLHLEIGKIIKNLEE